MEPTTSSHSDDESSTSAAMAAAMGFSTFGSHNPPAKKRKFNSATDAFVDGQDLKNLDKGGRKGQGSGGNTMPLGKMRVFGGSRAGGGEGGNVEAERGAKLEEGLGKGNENEIDLEDDSGAEDGPRYLDTSQPPPAEAGNEDGPQYIDTSQAPPAASSEEAEEMQRRIDAILASIEPAEAAVPVSSLGAGLGVLPPPPTLEDIQAGVGVHELPQRLVLSGADDGRGGSRGRGGRGYVRGGRGGGGRQRNERWYEGYYDKSFNENPWEKLEEERGLKPLGRWPESA